MEKKTIVQRHQVNFETLVKAFKAKRVALVECYDTQLKERVAVICAVNEDDAGVSFAPFARFFNGNPYDLLLSPQQVDEMGGRSVDAADN